MTLGEHLEELRSRMIRLLVGLLVGAVVCFVFRDRLMQVLLGPTFAVLRKTGMGSELVALDPMEPFMTTLKTSVIVGFILSAPYGLYQIWAFVAAGLYPREQRFVRRFVPVSIALFLFGCVFFLVLVMPALMNFLIYFMRTVPSFDPGGWLFGDRFVEVRPAIPAGPTTQTAAHEPRVATYEEDPADPPDGAQWINRRRHELRFRLGNQTYAVPIRPADQENTIRPTFSMRNTIDFTMQMAASFGIGFQVPVVVAFLATLGIASVETMARSRRVTWFVMAIAAAVFTPSTDPTTMLLLLIPMALLFEAGLFAARLIEKRKAEEGAADDRSRTGDEEMR